MNFIVNYIQKHDELKNLLVGNALNSVEEVPDEGTKIEVETSPSQQKFFISGQDTCFCKIVTNERGIFFYEKKSKHKD